MRIIPPTPPNHVGSPHGASNPWSRLALLTLVALLGLCVATGAQAQTFYVDTQSASCSDTGPGSEAQPYCTIAAAAAAHKGAGVTIVVRPGVYRELITVPASGAAGNPYVFQAQGSGVVVDGADDFSNPALWTLSSGTVWLASSVTWNALQVFADGARLTTSTAVPASLPANAFTWVSGEGLYVNLGGDNPGTHQTLVGHRDNAFNLSTKSWVTIDGFEIARTEDRGVKIQSGCSNLVIARNTVTFANSYGIHSVAGVDLVIEENVVSDCASHGIGLTAGATGCMVRANESFRNAHPTIRSANGIYLYGAPGNTVERNRVHDNQDTGIQIQSGSNDCVVFNNVSWNNGDHGFDHLSATGTIHVHDVAYGNYKDGFSIEGNSTSTRLFNCIGVNNGLTTNSADIQIDASSATGFISDYNIFWNATSQEPFKFMGVRYATLADYQAASGQDAHSLQADPRLVNPAAGDFHAQSGSPVVDSGDSGVPNWPATDADGQGRADVPAVPNTGAGSIPFADRGAFEYQVGPAPVAALTVTPPSGLSPLPVTADASASSDLGGSIVSYSFNFGDGTVVGPQAAPTATHTFASGTWTVTVTVTDDDGLTAATGQSVDVVASLVAALALMPATGNSPLIVTADASGSSTVSGTIVSFLFDFGNGATAGPQSEPTAQQLYTSGSYTVTVTVESSLGETASASKQVIAAGTGPGPNLVANPSFENDLSGWTTAGGANLAQAAGGFDGAYTLRAVGSSTAAFGIQDAPNVIASTPEVGTHYRFRAWVCSTAPAGSARIRVREFDQSGRQVGPPVNSSHVQLSTTWQLLTLDYLCELAGSTVDFRILDTPLAGGEVFDIDNISVNIVLDSPTVGVPLAGKGRLTPAVFPNPVRDRGFIRFALSQEGPVRVEIFDITGRRVRRLLDREDVPAAEYEFTFDGISDDGTPMGSGLYFYRVQALEGIATGRFLIVR